jgi:hypothetical protein
MKTTATALVAMDVNTVTTNSPALANFVSNQVSKAMEDLHEQVCSLQNLRDTPKNVSPALHPIPATKRKQMPQRPTATPPPKNQTFPPTIPPVLTKSEQTNPERKSPFLSPMAQDNRKSKLCFRCTVWLPSQPKFLA